MDPLWTTELPQPLMASKALVFDPLTDSIYVDDGWGTVYASICVRRIALESGSVIAAVRVRASVFSACLDPQEPSVLIAAGTRLIEVDRRTCAEIRCWKTGVPRHSHYSALLGRTVVMMGWMGPSLSVFDLETGRCRRKRLGSCEGLLKRRNGRVLVCCGDQGVIHEFDSTTQRVEELMRAGPFARVVYCCDADALVLSPARRSCATGSRLFLNGTAIKSESCNQRVPRIPSISRAWNHSTGSGPAPMPVRSSRQGAISCKCMRLREAAWRFVAN